MDAGSLEAILYEIKNGSIWTIIDEIWHRFEWIFPGMHYRFCLWSHKEDFMEE